MRNVSEYVSDPVWLAAAFDRPGATVRFVSEEAGFNEKTVRRWMAKYGIGTRSMSENASLRQTCQDAIPAETLEAIEGELLGDGNLTSTARPTGQRVSARYAPASRLAAVIDLDTAVEDTPERIAALAEEVREGDGASVYAYLQDVERGFAMPIRRIKEYEGFSADELRDLLGGFHPPQGYTLVGRHPRWQAVCDKLTAQPTVRETTLPVSVADDS